MTTTRRGGLRPTRVVALLLLVVPILEVMALVAVGQVIGGWPTFFLLVAISVLGAWLIRREGARAWGALVGALRSGRMPARELADGVLVLIGGTLLLTPGFLTDIVGFALVVPVTRPVARRLLETVITKRLLAQSPYLAGSSDRIGPDRTGPDRTGQGRTAGGDVIEGEIVDD